MKIIIYSFILLFFCFDTLCQNINLFDINRNNYTYHQTIKKQHDDIIIEYSVYFDDPKSSDEEHTHFLH